MKNEKCKMQKLKNVIFLAFFLIVRQCFAGIIQDVYNYPNPFSLTKNNYTTVSISLSRTADVEVRIFSLEGDLVKKDILRGSQNYTYIWRGRNDQNMQVSSGIYFFAVIIKNGNSIEEVKIRKIGILR
ncbi:MAG: T9SS type A sorting domain-containing protein [Elusimicrobia bacterium]|nr:T9SS type A sorting domain-containing protein [Elusimicrobiota bacterium]